MSSSTLATPVDAGAFVPARYEDSPAKGLAGLSRRYTLETRTEIPDLWGRFVPDVEHIPNAVDGHVFYGLVTNTPDGEGFDYMAAVAVSDAAAAAGLPAGFTTYHVPAQRYAVFPHEGTLASLCETIDGVFNRWLPASGHALTNTPTYFERYGENFDPVAGRGDLEIWVPITD
jgi:AraC family transcriptional regulator